MNQIQTESSYFEKNPCYRALWGAGKPRIYKFMLILSVWYVLAFVMCWMRGALFLDKPHAGIVQDLVMWSLFVALVTMVFLTGQLIRKLEYLFDDLPQIVHNSPTDEGSPNVQDDIERIREFVSLQTKSSMWWYRGTLASTVVLIYVFQIHLPVFTECKVRSWALWPQEYPVLFGFALIWSTFAWTVVIGNVAWYGLSIACTVFPLLHKYARADRIDVVPVAPDGKGGLSSIGSLAFGIALTASCGLLVALPWILVFGTESPAFNLGFPLYAGSLIGLFFLPLLSVHRAMRQARLKELKRWSREFRREYDTLPETSEDMSKLDSVNSDKLTYLTRVERLYTRAETMPVWPFNVGTVWQFCSIVIIPFGLYVVQIATENALTKGIHDLREYFQQVFCG